MWPRSILLVVLCFYIQHLHVTHSSGKKLPSYVNVCKRYDPEISKCWKNAVDVLKPYLVKGIPEFKIPPIDPFFIQSLRLDQGSSESIKFVADLVNLTFSGGKDFEIISVQPDYRNHIGALKMNFPRLTMNGQYKARGRVLLFQFDSSGKIEGDFKQITVNGTYFLETYTKKGLRYVRIKDSRHDVQTQSIYLYMHDLFSNNPEITESVNKAINDNIDLLYNDFKPLLTTTLGTVITEYTNRAYGQYPYDTLLPIE